MWQGAREIAKGSKITMIDRVRYSVPGCLHDFRAVLPRWSARFASEPAYGGAVKPGKRSEGRTGKEQSVAGAGANLLEAAGDG